MLALLSAVLLAVPQGLELKGAVTSSDGHALAKAEVFIAAAGPRTGIGVL